MGGHISLKWNKRWIAELFSAVNKARTVSLAPYTLCVSGMEVWAGLRRNVRSKENVLTEMAAINLAGMERARRGREKEISLCL